jgi:hypothetical protein
VATEDQPLIQQMRAALRADPVEFVVLVSSLLSAVESPADELDPFDELDAAGIPHVSLAEMVESFAGIDVAETTAALHVVAAMTADELLAARIRRGLGERRQPVPEDVRELASARVVGATLMGHELDDGDNVILSVRWPSGREVTPVVYIDHNLGTIVKDAFVINEPTPGVLDTYEALMAEEGHSGELVPLALEDARAKVAEAIEAGRDYVPLDPESEWPASRPFIQMLLRTMPEGGSSSAGRAGYPDLSVDEVVDGFLDSREAAALLVVVPEDELVEAAELLVSHAAEHAGHPLRWSGVSTEIALTQYLPWDPSVAPETLDAVPDVLPALVRYCHRVAGMGAESTSQALAAVEHYLPEFERVRALPSVVALRQTTVEVAAMLAGDPGPYRRRSLLEEVGGQAAADALDDAPLPDEPVDLSAVPADIHDVVRAVVELTDEFADEIAEQDRFRYADDVRGRVPGVEGDPAHGRRLAVELRTACRRFVARVAAADPAVFRRSSRADTAAAAVMWAVGRANGLVGPSPAPLGAGETQAWFGLSSSPSQRARTMLSVLVGDGRQPDGRVVLGSPDLLTSARRAALMRERDRLD